MKLHFLVHHVETKRPHGMAFIRFVEPTSGQQFDTASGYCGKDRWQCDVISFSLAEIHNVIIAIYLIDQLTGNILASISVPVSIIPFDFRISKKFLMESPSDPADSAKTFLMIHLSTFGQAPFHARKGSLLKHLKDATRKPQVKEAPETVSEIYTLDLDNGKDILPNVVEPREITSDPETLGDGSVCRLLGKGNLEWMI